MVTARRGVGVLVMLLALACGPEEPDRTGSWAVESAGVVYTGRRSGNTDVYVRLADRDTTIRLTDPPGGNNFARFSPDGRQVAFQSRRSGAIDLYVMQADGSGLRNLTDHPAYDVLPAWSPDGAWIAFMSTRGYELGTQGPFPGHLYLVRPDGGDLRQLTREPLTSSLGPQAWTRDGRSILLSRSVDGSLDLFLLDVDSRAETRLTTDPADEYGAAVSHDGQWIAFHVEADSVSNLWIMQLDGTGRRAVTSGPGRRYGPRWSPDDAWLLFAVEGNGESDYDLKAVRVADGHVRDIVVTPEDEREGDWLIGRFPPR